MSIPLNFNPLGFAQVSVPVEPSELPAGYTRLAFLGTTGSQYVDTGLAFGSETLLSVDVSVIEGCDYNTNAAILAGSIKHMNTAGLTITIGKSSHGIGLFWDAQGIASSRVFVEFGANRILASNSASGLIINGVTDKTWEYESWASAAGDTLWVGAPAAGGYAKFASKNARFYAASVSESDILQVDYIPAVNPSGAAGMFDKVTQTFFANEGTDAFIAGLETLDQLTALASNLPTVTDTPEIKLSLPGEWNGDASANAQLSIITGKGWQATTTYRDAATSSSSSFVWGNRGDGGSALVLWCRAVESEYGNYQDAEGVRYYVETCHDIWHPQELSPDDLGYTAVLTLEDYLTERGLTAVVYDEEELFTAEEAVSN